MPSRKARPVFVSWQREFWTLAERTFLTSSKTERIRQPTAKADLLAWLEQLILISTLYLQHIPEELCSIDSFFRTFRFLLRCHLNNA